MGQTAAVTCLFRLPRIAAVQRLATVPSFLRRKAMTTKDDARMDT